MSLNEIAKLLIYSPTGKMGFNPSNQHPTHAIKVLDQFYYFLEICAQYDRVHMNIFNNNATIISIQGNDELVVW